MVTTTRIKPIITYGINASETIGTIAKEKGITRALVVTDNGIYNTGIIDPIIKKIEESGVQAFLYKDVLPDPPDYMINEAAQFAKDSKVDGVISIGGGSVIDTGKAVNALVKRELPVSKWYAPIQITDDLLPMIIVPTTAGTGSECTPGSIVTNTQKKQKDSLIVRAQSTTVIDPLLYVGMPLMPSIYCGLDVVTHAVDSLVHDPSEPVSELYGKEALRQAYKYLPKLKEDPKNIEVRGKMALAATFGGAAIAGGMCHLTHCVGHSIGAVFHIPHGLACSFTLPEMIKVYAKYVPHRLRVVAECIGLEDAENIPDEKLGDALADTVLKFMKDLGAKNMKEAGLDLDEIMEKALPLMPVDFTMMFSPIKLGIEDFRQILTDAHDH